MIKVGDKIPNTRVKHMTSNGPAEISTDELFKGKTVVLFALPGAFTPTCSAKHLPGYLAKAADLKAKGVDTDRLPLGQRRLRHGRLGQGPAASATRS